MERATKRSFRGIICKILHPINTSIPLTIYRQVIAFLSPLVASCFQVSDLSNGLNQPVTMYMLVSGFVRLLPHLRGKTLSGGVR
jgi:hypothetical protein